MYISEGYVILCMYISEGYVILCMHISEGYVILCMHISEGYVILCMYISEGYVILSPTRLIIILLLTLADRQHVSALFKLPSSGLPVDNRYTKIPRQWDPIT
jgi:hypothetical protein